MQQIEAPTSIDCSTPFDLYDLQEPEFDDNAQVILNSRYLIKDEDNRITENPREFVWRVAVFTASAEILYEKGVYSKTGSMIDNTYIKEELFNPDLCKVYGMYDLSEKEDLKQVMLQFHVTEGTILALFRSWYYYQKMGRMLLDFDKFIDVYTEKFKTVVLPVAKIYYDLMAKLEFLPNTPTLMNSGMEKSLLSGCFVLPIVDDLTTILNTCRDAALVHKAGGGTGFAFSRLRPRGDSVGGRPTGASGPVSFMKVFNATTGEIKQGFSRRGANMGILNVHHPDIMEFISCKIPPKGATYVSPDDVPFSNFNISVAVTDVFMEAVKKNNKYPLYNPRHREIVDFLDAREVWNKIIHNAWENGDPGVIFIDEMNRYNPTPDLGDYESTNPCGEQVLLPNESCNLGAINLNKMMDGDHIDHNLLDATIRLCVRFLNDVLDMNYFPLKRVEDITRGNRKIGLGYMGFADILFKMRIPYDDQNAVNIGKGLAKKLTEVARDESNILTDIRGPFPNIDSSIFKKSKIQRFNASLTTIAPTGTTGIIANSVSGGIEPAMFLKYSRRTFEGDVLTTINPTFLEDLKNLNLDDNRVLDHVHKHGIISDIQPPEIFDDGNYVKSFSTLQDIYKVAHDISYVDHVEMQAAFQEYIDSSISKTINFPKNATVEDVENAFFMAYDRKCKGITIYRDGSKGWQVINISGGSSDNECVTLEPIKLPDELPARRFKVETGCGNIYVMVNYHPKTKKPLEIFVEMGKSGGCAFAWAHGVGRLVSIQLRYGLPVQEIIEQLSHIQCHNPLSSVTSKRKKKISSCIDAIAIILKDFSENIEGNNNNMKSKDRESRRECPKCGSDGLINTEGCVRCQNCNWSKCE